MKQIMFLSSIVSLLVLTGCNDDLGEYGSEPSMLVVQETVVFHSANLE